MSTLHLGYAHNGHHAALRELYSARPDAPVVESRASATPRKTRGAGAPLRRTRRVTAGALHRAATRIAPAA